MKYAPEHYGRIESLVLEYQRTRSQQASEELVRFFRPLLDKYIGIIKYGKIDLHDKDSRGFISLFMGSKSARTELSQVDPDKADQHDQIQHLFQEAYKSLNSLVRACASISCEDCMQELVAILLNIASKYKPRSPDEAKFCAYLMASFRYDVANYLKRHIKDPLTKASNIELVDEIMMLHTSNTAPPADVEALDLLPVLDDEWITGVTCDDIFGALTPRERLLIKLSYGEGLTDVEIAQRMGLHRNWIRELKQRATRKLEGKALEANLLRAVR